MSSKSRSEKQFFDERILGSGDFVKEIIDEAEASAQGADSCFVNVQRRLTRCCCKDAKMLVYQWRRYLPEAESSRVVKYGKSLL